MYIEIFEIDCSGCNNSIGMKDECYCENCMQKKDEEISEIVEKYENIIDELNEKINVLKRR